MAVKQSKADPWPISSDEETPSRGQRSLSPATGSGKEVVQTQLSRQMDLDEQVARLVQQKMEEMLPPLQVTGKRKGHDSEDESEWKDLSDQPESSDDSETEAFVVPKKRQKKKRAYSSDGDAFIQGRVRRRLSAKRPRRRRRNQGNISHLRLILLQTPLPPRSLTPHMRESMPRPVQRPPRNATLIHNTIQGHFDSFKPTELIAKLAEQFTGIKGVGSLIKEMDLEVKLSEDRKRFESVLHMAHKGVLSALVTVAPITNRMMVENKFTSLYDDMDACIALLTSTSNFVSYRRFEIVLKSICTDAGKEVV